MRYVSIQQENVPVSFGFERGDDQSYFVRLADIYFNNVAHEAFVQPILR